MTANEQLRSLGILYCVSYVVSLAAFSLALWLYWDAWRQDKVFNLLADVASTSAGTALLVIICWEGFRFVMVLFAAGRIKKLKEEGRHEERQKWQAWYRRFQEAQAKGQPFNEPPPPENDS